MRPILISEADKDSPSKIIDEYGTNQLYSIQEERKNDVVSAFSNSKLFEKVDNESKIINYFN